MESMKIRIKRWAPQIKKYFNGDLGAFYTHTANRLMLYPFIFSFFLVECVAFWLIYLGPSFVLEHMAFTTVYSLHKAAVYSICILGADILAHRLTPSWGAYDKRTVGRQWLIWLLGSVLGFVLHRTLLRSLIIFYAPDIIDYFRANPQKILSPATLLMILMPYWIVVMFLTMQIARSKQRIQHQANSLMVISPDNSSQEVSLAKFKGLPIGNLKLGGDNDNKIIALADITHVSVEDHYCHINYTNGDSLKKIMLRLPLKEILKKLPPEHFLQIHRSHVVNVGHISRLAKNGRDRKVVLLRFAVELPVSRFRFKDLLPELKLAGAANIRLT